MIWQSAISSSVLLCLFCTGVTSTMAATVSGQVSIAALGNAKSQRKNDASDIVVWLKPADSVNAHPASRHARMLQKDKRFTPHILVIATGTTVDFPNQDPIFHNAFSNFDGQIFDLALYAPGTSRSIAFNRSGVVRIFCNIHPAMSAVIVVVPSNKYTTTSRDGSFAIADVPPGEYTVHFFDERATPETLQLLTRTISVGLGASVLPPIAIPEASYLPAAHKNKYGRDYPANSSDVEGSYAWPVK